MEETEGARHLYGRTRYGILVLGLLMLTFGLNNQMVFSFTVICMDDVTLSSNGTHWLQSPTELNSLFSAVAIGCLIGTLPVSYLVQKWGIRTTCSFYGILSALATLFFPTAVSIGYPAALITRIIQGIPVSLSYTALGQISSQWSSEKGLGCFVAILSCHMQLSSIFTMPVSSAFCNSEVGWRGSFYLHGVLSMLIFAFFFFFYHDQPEKHRTVSSRELKRISRGKEDQGTDRAVPYRAILRDPLVWAMWSSLTANTLGMQMFFMYGPTYMNKVLGFDIRATGWGTALPFVLAAIGKLFLGPISDKATFISPRWRLVMFSAISQIGAGSALIVMGLTSSATVSHVSYIAAVVVCAFICVGATRGTTMVYRQHVHFVMAVASFLTVVVVLILPIAVALICPNNSPSEWSFMMVSTAIIIIILCLPYLFLARSEPAPCTQKFEILPVTEIIK